VNTPATIPPDLAARLAEPFEVREVKFKPQSVKGSRALAMAYIDARHVMDRLDDVLGVENWTDAYEIVPDGSVVCRLSLKVGGEWITKTDVGSPSEQPDGGDRLKAAFSDALKRAAVKFGIGRYLYRLPAVWADYDAQKRAFSSAPQLPHWALPKAKGNRPPAAPEQARPEPDPPATGPKAKKQADPKTLAELYTRLMAVETPAPAKLSGYLAGAAGHLSRLAVDCPPDTLADSLAAFLKLKPGEPIPFDKLTVAQVTSGWNHVKQTVKRFADSQAAPANAQPQ
jgi:hypothetical protein